MDIEQLRSWMITPKEGRAVFDGWRPISTAPKDRTRVILYCPDRTGRKVVEGYYGFNGTFKAWFNSDTGWHCKPTHWMPLPEPPIC